MKSPDYLLVNTNLTNAKKTFEERKSMRSNFIEFRRSRKTLYLLGKSNTNLQIHHKSNHVLFLMFYNQLGISFFFSLLTVNGFCSIQLEIMFMRSRFSSPAEIFRVEFGPMWLVRYASSFQPRDFSVRATPFNSVSFPVLLQPHSYIIFLDSLNNVT